MTSAREARRMAVAAQGFGALSPSSAGGVGSCVVSLVERLGVLQLDSVNVLARAHYLPLFARLGAYDQGHLDEAAWGPRPAPLIEYWAHQASLVPAMSHRLFRWRMDRARRGIGTWGRIAQFAKDRRAYIEKVLAEIAARGPLAASELSFAEKRKGGWWEWNDAKHAVETLFWQGRLAVATRRHFERHYDLPERVIPEAALAAATPDVATAHRELLAISARALGVGTEDDLCDYFRLARADARPRIAELVEEGVLRPTKVEGWDRPAFLHRDAARAARPKASALLAPFDPLVWHRPRALRLFGFHYRIGIYTPAAQRTHGYYALPFLHEDELVARVDLKAERDRGVLAVRGAWLEQGAAAEAVAPPLAATLGDMAAWLGLERIEVVRKGTLAAALRSSVGRR